MKAVRVIKDPVNCKPGAVWTNWASDYFHIPSIQFFESCQMRCATGSNICSVTIFQIVLHYQIIQRSVQHDYISFPINLPINPLPTSLSTFLLTRANTSSIFKHLLETAYTTFENIKQLKMAQNWEPNWVASPAMSNQYSKRFLEPIWSNRILQNTPTLAKKAIRLAKNMRWK